MVEIKITRNQRRALAISLWLVFTLVIALLPPILVALDAMNHAKALPEPFRHGELFSSGFALSAAAGGRCFGYLIDGEFGYVHFFLLFAAALVAFGAVWFLADIHDVNRIPDVTLWISTGAVVAGGIVGMVAELTRRER